MVGRKTNYAHGVLQEEVDNNIDEISLVLMLTMLTSNYLFQKPCAYLAMLISSQTTVRAWIEIMELLYCIFNI